MFNSVRQLLTSPSDDQLAVKKLHRSHQPRDLCADTLALILAGGRGSRLDPLTDKCCKPAVPFGGNFRIIDFALSNCINSGIRRVGVLSQYEQHSLLQHLNDSWNFLRRDLNEFINLMPACQREGASWYKGTADAITQNLDMLKTLSPQYTLVLAGDHVYKADFRRMIQHHRNSNAAITVACIEIPIDSAGSFGIVNTDTEGRITSFAEKPKHPTCIPDQPDQALASMGIYVFNTSLLVDTLEADALNPESSHDFGHDILPSLIAKHNVVAYTFSKHQSENYWRDVGTVDAYFETNMQLLEPQPELELHDTHWPIRCLPAQLPAARFIFDDAVLRGMASDSIVAAGCVLRGARVRHAILFCNVQIDELSEIHNALILPGVNIGARCRIRNAIIDSNTCIPDDTVIGFNPSEDSKRYIISKKGIVVVTEQNTHNAPAKVTEITSAIRSDDVQPGFVREVS